MTTVGPVLTTVGHGTLAADAFGVLVASAGTDVVVDVRSFPGSRRHPHFARVQMEEWLPDFGVAYRWERALGGFRKPDPHSRNVALRHPAFRGYADHMRTTEFRDALGALVAAASGEAVTVMCSESLWWRCHRRLLSDAIVLSSAVDVRHLLHDGRTEPHRVTEGARLADDGLPVYDAGTLF